MSRRNVHRDLTGEPLTDRERRVLELIAEGWTVDRIAKTLAMSERAVDFDTFSIKCKLGAADRVNAVHLAHLAGFLPPSRIPGSYDYIGDVAVA